MKLTLQRIFESCFQFDKLKQNLCIFINILLNNAISFKRINKKETDTFHWKINYVLKCKYINKL